MDVTPSGRSKKRRTGLSTTSGSDATPKKKQRYVMDLTKVSSEDETSNESSDEGGDEGGTDHDASTGEDDDE